MITSLAIFASLFLATFAISSLILFNNSIAIKVFSNYLLILFLGKFSWKFANFLWRNSKFIKKEKIKSNGKSVLITGCDTGFGNRLARRLDGYGFKVFACCLFPDGDGAKDLEKSCSSRLHVLRLNVTIEDDVNEARIEVEKSLGDTKLWAIVNNAGVLVSTEVEFGGMDCFTKQMDINCIGMVRVTKAFIPLLRRSRGRIVNVASLAGRFSIPGMVGYCMSKCAVISFSEGLRREMKKWDIDVVTIEPHLFKTNLCDDEAQQSALIKAWNETPQDIRNDYGSCYLEGYKKFLDKVMGSARLGINDVVDAMFSAVTDQFIGPNIMVLGELERVRINIWEQLPARVLDYISYWACLMTTGRPGQYEGQHEKKIF